VFVEAPGTELGQHWLALAFHPSLRVASLKMQFFPAHSSIFGFLARKRAKKLSAFHPFKGGFVEDTILELPFASISRVSSSPPKSQWPTGKRPVSGPESLDHRTLPLSR